MKLGDIKPLFCWQIGKQTEIKFLYKLEMINNKFTVFNVNFICLVNTNNYIIYALINRLKLDYCSKDFAIASQIIWTASGAATWDSVRQSKWNNNKIKFWAAC